MNPTLEEIEVAMREAETYLDHKNPDTLGYTVDADRPGVFRPRTVFVGYEDQFGHLPERQVSTLTWALYRAMLIGLGEALLRERPSQGNVDG